jgi:hypothetical protein
MISPIRPSRTDSSAPSIEEMRHELGKPEGRDYFRLIPVHHKCYLCGSEKPDWWFIRVNGQRICSNCVAAGRDQELMRR